MYKKQKIYLLKVTLKNAHHNFSEPNVTFLNCFFFVQSTVQNPQILHLLS